MIQTDESKKKIKSLTKYCIFLFLIVHINIKQVIVCFTAVHIKYVRHDSFVYVFVIFNVVVGQRFILTFFLKKEELALFTSVSRHHIKIDSIHWNVCLEFCFSMRQLIFAASLLHV